MLTLVFYKEGNLISSKLHLQFMFQIGFLKMKYTDRDYSRHFSLQSFLLGRMSFMVTVYFVKWHSKRPHGVL